MSVETTVTDELQIVASAVDSPPPPSVEALVRRAGRERTRTRATRAAGILVVAAAVVGTVVIGSQFGRPTTAPQPVKPSPSLPVGSPPQVPYVIGDTLYMYDEPVAGKWWGVETVNGATVALRAVPPVGKPVLFRNDLATHLLDHAIGEASLSATGTMLAWLEKSRTSAHLVVHDLSSGRELGRLALDPSVVYSDTEAQENILRVDDDGTVTYGGLLAFHTWRPGGVPTTFTPSVADTVPKGYPSTAIDVRLNPDGNWGAWLTDRDGRTPPADRTDWTGVLDGVTFQGPFRPDSLFTLALPVGTDARSLVWESATDVLVMFFDGPGEAGARFIRCDILEDPYCEYAPTPTTP
jgi:hypothetical protein